MKMPARLRNRVRIGNADAIESERAGFMGERGFQFGGGELGVWVQKSRST